MNTEFWRGSLGRTLNPHLLALAFIAMVVPVSGGVFAQDAGRPRQPIVIQARVAAAPPQPLPFPAGGRSPDGHTLSVNDRYLMRDGEPWFPVMGEFQYSRYPESRVGKRDPENEGGWDSNRLDLHFLDPP